MPSPLHAAPRCDRPTKASVADTINFDPNATTDDHYFSALARFDINLVRPMWVYQNVRPNSSVLDISYAGEMFGMLKRQNARLTAITPTVQRARAARANGYDAACAAHPARLPFPDASFDHVVSLELFDRFTGEEMKAIITEIKRVLRCGGTTLLGAARPIALTHRNENARKASASQSSLFGAENSQEKHTDLLRSHFAYVDSRARDALCLSSEEFLREADRLRFPVEEDFLHYLRGLSFRERRAFDMAMGYVYDKLNRLGIETPKNNFYIFARASDQPLTSFTNEGRNRRELLKPVIASKSASVLLERTAAFDEGWHETRDLPPLARLMSECGRVHFTARSAPERIRLDLTTHMPTLKPRGLSLDIFVNNVRACSFTLFRYGWLELEVALPPSTHNIMGNYELEIRADRTWSAFDDDSAARGNGRRYSIAVCNLEAIMKEEEEESEGKVPKTK